MSRLKSLTSLLCLFTVGCAVSESKHDKASPPPDALSNRFRILGHAVGNTTGLSIDCLCNLVVEVQECFDSSQCQGVHGGEFSRTVLHEDGSGISLQPEVYGDIEITLAPPDRLVMVIPANVDATSRFWKGVSIFNGR